MPEPSSKSVLYPASVAVLVVAIGVVVWLAVKQAGPAMPAGPTPKPAKQTGPAVIDPDEKKVSDVVESASVYLSQGEVAKAEAILDSATKQWPTRQDVHLAFADFLMRRAEPERAYSEFEKALSIGPRAASIESMAGTIASGLGKLDRAEEHFAAAHAAEPNNADHALNLALVKLRIAELYPARSKNLKPDEIAPRDEAKGLLAQVIQLDPTKAVAWASLAELELRDNKATVAKERIAKARALEPDNYAFRVIEARACLRLTDGQGALAVLEALPAQQRDQRTTLELLEQAYGLLKRPQDAAAAWNAAAERHGDDVAILMGAATASERAGDKTTALTRAKQAAMLGDQQAGEMAKRLGGT